MKIDEKQIRCPGRGRSGQFSVKMIPPKVAVMLFRNEADFDFEDRKWTLSDKTRKLLKSAL